MKRKEVRDRVVVTRSTVERTRIFSIRRLLTYNLEDYKTRGLLISENPGYMDEGLPLAKRIFEIEGVQGVAVSQYDIWVTIGRAFTWDFDGIEDEVTKVIKNYLAILDMQDDASDKPAKPAKKKPETGK